MDFIEKIQALAARVPKQVEHCQTEEATKNALVLPFITALGYDVFNPTEVVPEFTADIGTKKGEKIDYAIMRDETPVILFECKWSGADLNREHMSQLFRYFAAVPEVRFGVLTNGLVYRFYSDLDSPNRIDDKPFFEFNVLDFQDRHVAELKKFSKPTFNLDEILATASELKYTAAIQRIIAQEFEQPSEDFIRYVTSQVYSGRMTKAVRDQFAVITRSALRRFLNDRVNERLKSALDQAVPNGEAESIQEVEQQQSSDLDSNDDTAAGVVRRDKQRGIVTTEDEIEGYFAVKSILGSHIDTKRVHMRDGKTYCSVLLDDNNRKPICRLHFNRDQKYLGLFDDNKVEQRVPIAEIDDIYTHSSKIVATVKYYDAEQGVPPPPTTRSSTESPPDNYTGTKPAALIVQGKRRSVTTWKEVLLTFLELMKAKNLADFDKTAPTIAGRKRPYITQNPTELRSPESIAGTSLYVETNLDANSIVKLCRELYGKMGYPENELEFEV